MRSPRNDQQQGLLLDVTGALLRAELSEEAIARTVFERVARHLPVDCCFNYKLSPDGTYLELVAAPGEPENVYECCSSLAIGQAFSGTVAQLQQALNANAARIDADPLGEMVRGLGLRSYACHPLFSGEGKLLGTFSFASRTREGFDAEEVELFQALSNYVALAWERIDAERRRSETEMRLRTAALEHESTVARERDLLSGILDGLPGVFYLYDRSGRFLRWNRHFEEIAEYSAEEMRNAHPLDFFHESEKAVVAGTIKTVFETGFAEVEATFVTKSGKRIPYHFNGVIVDIEGEPHLMGMGLDITARKQAEDHLAAVLTASGMGSWVWDLATGMSVFSQREFELLGLEPTAGPVEIKLFLDRIHPDDLDDLIANAGEAVRSDRNFEHEFRVKLPNGDVRWLASRGRPVHSGSDDEPPKMFGVNFDITDQKRHEAELERTNYLLESISDLQTEFLISANTREVFERVLATLLRVTEGEYGFIGEVYRDDVSGEPFLRTHAITNIAWDEASRQYFDENIERGLEFRNLETLFGSVLRTGKPLITNDPSGDKRSGGLPKGHPPLDSFMGIPIVHGGEMTGMIGVANRPGGFENRHLEELRPLVNTCGSIIQAMRTEKERRLALERLAASQLMLETVLNNIPQGVFWKDRNSVYLGCNTIVSAAAGLSYPSEVIGKTDRELSAISPAQADAFVNEDREVMNSGVPRLGIVQPVMIAGNRQVWLETNKIPLRDPHGEIIGVLGTWTDITEKRRLEDQLRQSQKMDAFGQLAAGVAHDFNNLLTIISGYSDILLMKLPEGDPRRPAVVSIGEASERAAALTRQLLAFSRLTVLDPRVIDLNEVVEETERMLCRLIGEHISLKTSMGSRLAPIKVDAGQIGQVILNLAINARDAMPRGGVLTIETRNVHLDAEYAARHLGARSGNHVLLAVTDTGTGIAPEVLPRIFEPFFTTKGPGKGTGLGLAVVHGIVKQSGGSIEVASDVGTGTSFKVYLPAAGENGADTAAGGLPESMLGRETILVVEDEAAVRGLAVEALGEYGYDVLEAGSGAEALYILKEQEGRIALLLTDVVMPGMDGGQLAENVKTLYPHVKIIFVSGYTDDAIVRHGILHEQVAFLQKPYNPTALAAKVREILDE